MYLWLPCLHFFIGGAISNLYGMLAARHSRFPEIKQKGMSVTGRIVVFTSKQVNIVVLIRVKSKFTKNMVNI
jgi:hypothetical protein